MKKFLLISNLEHDEILLKAPIIETVTEIFNNTQSQEVFSAAQELMPGGVSSPVRAFKSVGGKPIVFDRVKGPFAWDIDGNRYIDYIGSWGPVSYTHLTLPTILRV